MPMTDEEVRQHYDEASQAYSSGDFRRAGEMFSELLIEPEALGGANELHWNYAMCLAHEGNWELALEHVRAAGFQESDFRETMRQSNVTDARHDFEQATELYRQQRWSEAADAFTALLLHPGADSGTTAELHWNIAICLAHCGDWETAIGHVRTSGYSESDFRETMRQSNVTDAGHDFEQATQLYRDQRWSEAADAFTELLLHPGADSSTTDELHWNIAMCLAHLGQWDTAFGHIRSSGGSLDEFRQTCTQQGLTPPADES